jgi:hypothetical protein
MSAEARGRIPAAQKKRWAAQKDAVSDRAIQKKAASTNRTGTRVPPKVDRLLACRTFTCGSSCHLSDGLTNAKRSRGSVRTKMKIGVTHSMDRLARNMDDLRKIVLGSTERVVDVRFAKENPDSRKRPREPHPCQSESGPEPGCKSRPRLRSIPIPSVDWNSLAFRTSSALRSTCST